MNRTQVERTSRWRESHSKKGLKRVDIWVPEDRVEQLKEMAGQWREEHRKKTR